ncbi:hypothetical protein Csa_016310, partial [Cucumis sativus]
MATSRSMLRISQKHTTEESVFDVPFNDNMGASPSIPVGGLIDCKPKGFIR